MKNKEEITKYLRENPIKNVINLLDIEKCLNNDGMTIPDGVATINSMGVSSADFIKWYETCEKKYPKTYEECCYALGFNDRYDLDKHISTHDSKYDLILRSFYMLLICRNAYYKIAGDWEPNFGETFIYAIGTCYGTVEKRMVSGGSGLLLFPTEEMRDAFYENFKEQIEECKELLWIMESVIKWQTEEPTKKVDTY